MLKRASAGTVRRRGECEALPQGQRRICCEHQESRVLDSDPNHMVGEREPLLPGERESRNVTNARQKGWGDPTRRPSRPEGREVVL